MGQVHKHHPEVKEQAPKHHPVVVEQGLEDLSCGIKRPFQVSNMISLEKLHTINGVDYNLKIDEMKIKDRDGQKFKMTVETKTIGTDATTETKLKVNNKVCEHNVRGKIEMHADIEEFDEEWKKNWKSSKIASSCSIM